MVFYGNSILNIVIYTSTFPRRYFASDFNKLQMRSFDSAFNEAGKLMLPSNIFSYILRGDASKKGGLLC